METKVNNKNVRKKYLIKFSHFGAMACSSITICSFEKKLKRKPKNGT